MDSKVSSDWLPSYNKETFKMTGYFSDSRRISNNSAWNRCQVYQYVNNDNTTMANMPSF
jgi:hypothetical protein